MPSLTDPKATVLSSPSALIARLAAGAHDCVDAAEALNAGCQCVSLDRQALVAALARDPRDGALQAMIAESRPHLFAESMAFVSAAHVQQMADLVAAIHRVVALPGWQDAALAHAPESARQAARAVGARQQRPDRFGWFLLRYCQPRQTGLCSRLAGG